MLNNDQELNACRVCGLIQDNEPWGEDGKTPTFEICVCCGTEFGYEDATLEATKRTRRRWLGEGAIWFSPEVKPEKWDLDEQLEQVPEHFK